MAFLFTILLFLAVTAVAVAAGMRLYVRPKEAIERVTGAGVATQQEMPTHPSLVLHDLVQRMGTLLPANPKDVGVLQRRLIRADIRNPDAVRIVYGAKVVLGVGLPVLLAGVKLAQGESPLDSMLSIVAMGAFGFLGPNEYVNMRVKRRKKLLARGLANGLDLLVVCVESGLGLDQAIVQTAKELEHAHPEISEELTMVTLEMKAGKRRMDALRNLADRTGVEDLKKLVAVLIQADRFGTGIAQSLRAHAEYMRIQARQVAEEKAAKLGVKLVFPIFFCILPSLFVVTVGPVAVKIYRELIPMMQNM